MYQRLRHADADADADARMQRNGASGLEQVSMLGISWHRGQGGIGHVFGHVDGMIDGYVRGWAVDRRQPSSRIRIRFGHEAALDRSTLADRHRADVQAAGHCIDGYCGFLIVPEPGWLRVLIEMGDARRRETVVVAPSRRRLEMLRRGSRIYAVERAGDWITGYALDLAHPVLRCALELQRRDGECRRLIACRYDGEARPTPEHDGFHGFRVPRTTNGCLRDAATDVVVAAWGR